MSLSLLEGLSTLHTNPNKHFSLSLSLFSPFYTLYTCIFNIIPKKPHKSYHPLNLSLCSLLKKGSTSSDDGLMGITKMRNKSKPNHPCGSRDNKPKLRKGLCSPDEDEKLIRYMLTNGQGCWSEIARNAGLSRCGKSCRLRWINYLRPDLKRGSFSPQEEDLIFHLHSLLGNSYTQLPGRTDNEIKNFWNSTLKKRLENNNNNNTFSGSLPNNIDFFDPKDQHVDMGGKSNPMMDSYHHHHDDMMVVGNTMRMDSSSFSFAPVVSGVSLNQFDSLFTVPYHNRCQQMGTTENIFNANGLGDYGNVILDPIGKRACVESERFLPPTLENTNVVACTRSNSLNRLGMENSSCDIENPKIGDWDLDGLIYNNSSFPFLDFQVD